MKLCKLPNIAGLLLMMYLVIGNLTSSALAANRTVDSLKTVIETQEDTLLLASIKELDSYIATQSPDETLVNVKKGFEVAKELDHLYYMAEMLNLKGAAHYYMADYDKAVESWERGLRYCEEFTEEEYMSEVRNRLVHSTIFLSLGVVKKMRGEYSDALEHYFKSLDIRKTTGNKRGIADCYVNIGVIYVESKNDEKALEYYLQAKTLYEEVNHIHGHASVLNNIGLVHKRAKRLEEAREYFEKSLARYKEIDHRKFVSQSYINLGLLYKDFDDCDRALDYFSLALIIKKEISDKLGIAWCYQYIGECYAYVNQNTEALDYYFRALTIFEEIQVAKNQLACYQAVSDIYAKIGNYERAYEFMLKYDALNQSVYSADMSRQLAEQEARYANKEKEQQLAMKDIEIAKTTAQLQKSNIEKWALIAGFLLVVAIAIIFIQRFRIEARFHKVLERQNEELKETYEDLKATVISKEEKEVMIKEIHHRVKNNLQIISSLINIQANSVDDSKVQRMFREVQNRIISMSLLHEQLYKAPDLAHVNVQEYLEVLLNNLMAIYADDKEVQLYLEIEVESMSVDTLIPIGLLINEAVTNSLKYAFTGMTDGIISIVLKPIDQNGYLLLVEDNGIGMPEDQFKKYSDSLGMELIRTFVSQLDGEVEVDVSNGTSYRIEMYPIVRSTPLSPEKSGVPAL